MRARRSAASACIWSPGSCGTRCGRGLGSRSTPERSGARGRACGAGGRSSWRRSSAGSGAVSGSQARRRSTGTRGECGSGGSSARRARALWRTGRGSARRAPSSVAPSTVGRATPPLQVLPEPALPNPQRRTHPSLFRARETAAPQPKRRRCRMSTHERRHAQDRRPRGDGARGREREQEQARRCRHHRGGHQAMQRSARVTAHPYLPANPSGEAKGPHRGDECFACKLPRYC